MRYPNENIIQPRYGAWLASMGLPVTLDSVAFARQNKLVPEFFSFIARAKAEARKVGAVGADGRVVDHDVMTACCWSLATAECCQRFAGTA